MKKIPALTRSEARKIALYSQGLTLDSQLDEQSPAGVLEHLSYIQLDTISVIARAHDHILFTRVENGASLNQLVQQKEAFEYWSHAASYLPMRDFRFSLPRKQRFASGEWHWFQPTVTHKKLRPYILKRIEKEGPLGAKDFESTRKTSGWFDWKPAKQMLEQLFMEGKLMVKERRGFQKIYDLTERVVPEGVDQRPPTKSEFADHLVESHLRAHGLMNLEEISYLRPYLRQEIRESVKRGIQENWLMPIEVEDRERVALREDWDQLWENAKNAKGRNILLSPFDNLVIRRKRFAELFGFNYTLECYVPEKKRKWGYFCLPALVAGEFVGLVDLKVDRKKSDYELKNFHPLEKKNKKAIWKKILPEVEKLVRFSLTSPSDQGKNG